MDTLALGCTLPAIGRVTDLHRLENARAGRTQKAANLQRKAAFFVMNVRNKCQISKFETANAAIGNFPFFRAVYGEVEI